MGSVGLDDDIYQSVILDHSRHPRNFGVPVGATHTARGDNPFCGDRITVAALLSSDRITTIGFEGAGCAISTASASMMTVMARGMTRAEVEALYQRFGHLLDGESPAGLDLADLSAFAGVSRFPVRIKCARLAWQTLRAALLGAKDTVSTE